MWLTAGQQRVWRDYLRLERLLPAQLNRELQAGSGLSLSEYEVLVHLSEANEGRLRPFQLHEAMQWEQSRLSHQLTRMERRGLVHRENCPDEDGRGAYVALTTAGRSAIESAAPAHAATVLELVFGQMTEEQTAAFGQVCEKILAAVEQASPPAPAPARTPDPCH
jgi:DNA-binding MarR family transcriptional regulator